MSRYIVNLMKRLTGFNKVLSTNGMASSTIEVGELFNDNETSTFFLPVNSGMAFVSYSLKKFNIIELHTTEVPVEYRSKGIGSILAKEVFDYCINNKLKMVLTCDFLQKFYQENPLPEYKKFVVKSE